MGKKLVLGENDFASKCKRENKEYLLDEWDYTKNPMLPTEIGFGFSKKIWWICPVCKNSYQATTNHRFEGTGCRKCSYKLRQETRLKNRIKNKDTFGDKYPELLKEWDYERNTGVDPFQIAPNHTKNVWWICKRGHHWQAITPNRIKGRGCPYCSNHRIIVGENDFASTNPELLKFWDYDKNEIKPTEITSGSPRQVYWKCEKGHSWKSTIGIKKKYNCPVCSGRKVLAGYNDLATVCPELVKEWDYEKNDITPQEVVRGSEVYVWWKCEYGHSWRAKITNRVHGTGCPECMRYIKTSFYEQAIYYYVKKAYPDVINTYTGEGFEIDVFIPSIRTGIEYDGQRWHKILAKDVEKNKKCKAAGIRLIRIRENGCPKEDKSFDKCIHMKNNHDNAFEDCLVELLFFLGVVNIDVDLDRDRAEIYDNYIVSQRENSIAIKAPELVKEWHPTKNKSVTPYMLPYGTHKKAWWLCAKGHEWQSTVASRTTGEKTGCPICSNKKIVKGINDLTTTNPELLALWDYEKNSVSPDEIGLGYSKKVWWKCDKNHSWKDTPHFVDKNQTPCPICGNRQVLTGFNDFATIHKDGLLKEWNYDRNVIDPTQIAAGVPTIVWWRCSSCNHEWQAKISNRVYGNKTGCPICADKRRLVTRRTYIKESGRSLAEVYPEITKDWHPYLNRDLPFDQNTVGAHSNEKVWWKCHICGNEWQAIIRARTRYNSKCRKCAQEEWNQKYGKKVMNVETGEIFGVASEAAKKYGCTTGNISACCRGATKSACGYHWKYVQ